MNTTSTKSSTQARRKGTITRLKGKREQTVSAADRYAAEGLDLATVLQELDEVSEINASRVVKLHDRIAAGEYTVDAERVAGKMLELEGSLDK